VAGAGSSAAIRAFVAVLLDAATRAALRAQIESLRRAAPRVAWVAPESVHLTLKFLGHVDPALIEPVSSALQGALAGAPPFDLEILGLGAFPTVSRARVIWAGVGAGRDAVAALAGRVEAALEPLGFARESRPFSPHLTLGRAREPRRNERLATLVADGAGRAFGRFRVGSASLMQSILGQGGARYSSLSSVSLSGH